MKKNLLLFILLSLVSFGYSQTCAPIISGPNTVCVGTTVGYTAYSSPPGSLSWYINGGGSFLGSPINPVNPQINWTTPGTWQITVSALSCPGSPSTTYTVNVVNASTISAPTLITGPLALCNGTTSTYSVPAIAGLTPIWMITTVSQFGSQPVLTPTGNQVSVTWPGTFGNYILSASYSNGTCSGAQKSVTIVNSTGTAPVSLYGNGTDAFCLNQTYNFTASGDFQDTFTWSLPSGGTITPTGNSALVQWTSQGSFVITVTATNPCGAPRSASRTISVGPPVPSAPGTITRQNSLTCLNQTERLSVSAVAGATSYKWTIRPSNGLFAYTTSVPYIDQTFSANGPVTASVIASNGFCDSPSSPDFTFTAGIPPMQTSFPSPVCVGTPVTVSITSTGSMSGYTFTWNVGNGIIIGPSTGSSISVKWDTPGTRGITAQASTPCGDIAVPTPPSFITPITVQGTTFTLSPISGVSQACLGEYSYTSMTDVPSTPFGPGITPNWTITLQGGGATTGGTISQTLYQTKVTWNTPGNYTLTATATNACGFVQSQSMNVTVANGPKPTTPYINGVSSEVYCTASFPSVRPYSVPATAGYTYAWGIYGLPGDAISSSANTATVTWSGDGVANVYVIPSSASCTGERTYLTSSHWLNSTIGTLSSSGPSTACAYTSIPITLSLTSATGSVTYRVRKKGDNGAWSSWTDLSSPNYTIGYAGFSVEPVYSAYYFEFQAVAQSGACTPAYSNVITFTGYVPPAFSNPSSYFYSKSICSGDNVSLIPTSNTPGMTVSWTSSVSGGSVTGAPSSGAGQISNVLTNTGLTIATVNYSIIPTANGCNGPTYTTQRYVYPIPVVAPSQVKSICTGDNVNYGILVSPEVELNWPDPDGSGPATGATNRTGAIDIADILTNAGTTPIQVTYQVTPFNRMSTTSGCAGPQQNVVITVKPRPIMTSPISAAVCSKDPLNHPLTSNITSTYFWYATNNPNTSGESTGGKSTSVIDDRITSSSLQTVNYTVTPTSNSCAGLSQNVAVLVNPLPVATITPASINCSASSVTLTGSTGAGLTYQWIKDGVNIPSATASNYTASLSGTYTLQVTGPNNCKNTSMPAYIVLRPVAAITGPPTTICIGGSGTISGTITANGAWTLTLNNGAGTVTGNGSGTWSKSVSPTSTTTYAITSLADASCSSVAANLTGSQTITVSAKPVANISGPPITICSGTSVTLSGTVTAIGSWTLTLSDGGVVTGTGSGSWNKAVIPATTTTYTLTSLVDAWCTSVPANLTGSRVVTVKPTPIVVITPPTGTKCPSGTIGLTASGASSYSWSPANGLSSSTSASVGCYVSNTTTYTVTGTTNGCTATAQVLVTVKNIDATITASTTSFCQGIPVDVYLLADAQPNYTYEWKRNGTIMSTGTLPNYHATQPGSYTVTVVAPFGCSATGPATIINQSNGTGSIRQFYNLCTDGYADLRAGGNPGTGSNYVWSTTETTQTIQVNDPGSYSVTYTSAIGCVETASILVERIGNPCIYARIASPNPVQSEVAEKITDSKELTAHPNPANQTLTVEIPSAVKKSTPIVLYDTFGKISYKSEFKAGEKTKTIPTAEFANGLYMLEVLTPTGANVIRKVIISH